MSLMLLLLLLLLVLLCQTMVLPGPSASDPCVLELEELRRDVRTLQNKLLIGAWQLTHLKTHSYTITHPPPSTNQTEEHRTGALASLPPAGSLIVHDKGENLVKIDLMDWSGEKTHVYYQNFRITEEKDSYRLRIAIVYGTVCIVVLEGRLIVYGMDSYRLRYGVYSGRGGDALSGGGRMVEQWSASLSGMQFSTRDQDHDRYLQGSCAQENRGGWWYNRCHAANLNGKFYRGGVYKGLYDNGVVWGTWRGLWYSLRHTTIKLRPLLSLDSLAGSGSGPDG
ncbi:fibrinogen like 1B isoform X5 [Coregonus clupeaformis]|uniref:fibrinogen like 1B isoform X5 n=1 Tax=Coregonus clupeaformis TaxID=59861 RepID=UPI001E1C5056|nr:fibrinogen like 1B isoform X5 [Coregonus clupeaformis]